MLQNNPTTLNTIAILKNRYVYLDPLTKEATWFIYNSKQPFKEITMLKAKYPKKYTKPTSYYYQNFNAKEDFAKEGDLIYADEFTNKKLALALA